MRSVCVFSRPSGTSTASTAAESKTQRWCAVSAGMTTPTSATTVQKRVTDERRYPVPANHQHLESTIMENISADEHRLWFALFGIDVPGHGRRTVDSVMTAVAGADQRKPRRLADEMYRKSVEGRLRSIRAA